MALDKEGDIQRVRRDFLDKDLNEAWGILDSKMAGGKFQHLVHPLNMKKETLRDLIPSKFKMSEILNSLPVRQKELVKRLNVSRLSSASVSSMYGQMALFEILRNRGYNFQSYVNGFYSNLERSRREGYTLLFTLGYIYYLRRFFGYTPIDLVRYLSEPITRYHLTTVWDENWLTRAITNINNLSICNLSNKSVYQILRNLMPIQDSRGMTIARVMEWTGRSRADVSHLIDVLRASRIEHRYRIVSKNTGTAKILRKSQSKWESLPSFFSFCTSLSDSRRYYVSVNDVFHDDVGGKYFEMEAFNTNIDLYDIRDQSWKSRASPHVCRKVQDIHALLQNGDSTIPANNVPPTNRDIFFIALLTAMSTSHRPDKTKETIDWFTRGYGIPKDEAERGIRNVLRKNMLRNQYTHFGLIHDRDSLSLVFDDKRKKVIPFLGEILQNLPISMLQVNTELSCGYLLEFHPAYMSCELRNLIESSMKNHDVNGEIFVVHSWGFGHPGSILQLVSSQAKS